MAPITASRRIPQLDGLRGVAILLVILHNQGPSYPWLHLDALIRNGWMGVDLFFVLSGFLITGILLDTSRAQNRTLNFYVRRCLRIWPLYYAVLVFMFVLVPLVRPEAATEVFAPRSSPWWAYPVFLQNFLVPVPTSATGPLGVTWSLAIEELFYLVWPWIVWSSMPRRLGAIAIGVIALSPALRLFLSGYDVNLYSNPFCRLDGLMAGALLAPWARSRSFGDHRLVRSAWPVLAGALFLALMAERADARWMSFSLVSVAAAALVLLALSEDGWLKAALSNRFLVHIGTISYGLYLLHKIPFDVLRAFGGGQSPQWLTVGLLGCYVAALMSWYLLERPFLAMKRSFDTPTASTRDLAPARP